MTRVAVGPILVVSLLWAACRLPASEVFVLANGGRVEGEWLNRDELLRKSYVIETSPGSRITLERAQVKEVLHIRPKEQEYRRVRPAYPDTVEGQWALAQWCLEERLTEQRKAHLRRVIELDPEHVEARGALGYGQIGGRWMTQEEAMTEWGYRLYHGRWMTPQEIWLIEGAEKIDRAEKEWGKKINRWRDWLEGDKAEEAYQNLVAIDDPNAVPALIDNLEGDPASRVRILFVEILAKIGTPEAIKALAVCSIEDPVEEVRLTCLDCLEKKRSPAIVAFYVDLLQSENNEVINLAAEGLARMKDTSAIGPLISRLVTVHSRQIGSSNPGGMSVSFPTGGSPGGTGLSMNDPPKIETRTFRNQSVLDALIALTGQNFDFNPEAWRLWHASQRHAVEIDARRD